MLCYLIEMLCYITEMLCYINHDMAAGAGLALCGDYGKAFLHLWQSGSRQFSLGGFITRSNAFSSFFQLGLPPKGSTISQNSPTRWGPSVQTHGPGGDTSHSNRKWHCDVIDEFIFIRNRNPLTLSCQVTPYTMFWWSKKALTRWLKYSFLYFPASEPWAKKKKKLIFLAIMSVVFSYSNR